MDITSYAGWSLLTENQYKMNLPKKNSLAEITEREKEGIKLPFST
jgi:hypothetical protein